MELDSEDWVQLSSEIIPHENDTDDIAVDVTPLNYDSHHSKAWNEQVNQRALEIEREMKIADNMELAQQKAKEEAKIKADRMKYEAEEARKKKDAQEKWAKEHAHDKKSPVLNPYKTIDLGELYKDISDVQLFDDQTGEIIPYRHHSELWENEVNEEARALEK